MRRMSRTHSSSFTSIVSTLVLAAGALAVTVPEAGAATNTCQARNLTQGTPSGSDLQAVIDTAGPGDTIQVKRICVGHFEIFKDLTIIGQATTAVSQASLDGNGSRRVLNVGLDAEVTLTDVLVTNGVADLGGGILNRGILTLDGSSSVGGNTATAGGGGISNPGTLILNDSSSVSGNQLLTSDGFKGGGIRNHGSLTLNDSASVNENIGAVFGGGIWNSGNVALNGSATVSHNRADHGAGISSGRGPRSVILNDSSSITGNAAVGNGGGIFHYGAGTVILNDSSSVSGNSAAHGGGLSVGGPHNARGRVTLNDGASVSDNEAVFEGGGVYNGIHLTLNGSSSVSGNSAARGGGIFHQTHLGSLTLNDSASVIDNMAVEEGGGIFVGSPGPFFVASGWSGTVAGNIPDDCEPDDLIQGCD